MPQTDDTPAADEATTPVEPSERTDADEPDGAEPDRSPAPAPAPAARPDAEPEAGPVAEPEADGAGADGAKPESGPDAEPDTEARARPRRPWQAFPRIVWCVMALHVVALGAYSILLPTYRSPDEPLHVDMAHLLSEELTYPAYDERDTDPGVIASLDIAPFNNRSHHLNAAHAPPKGDRPSFEELSDPDGRSGRNQMPQHPPLYYAAAGTAERVVEVFTGDPDFMQETWFYRFVSIAFTAALPLVIWRTAKTLRLPDAVGVAATLVPLAIPQYLHIAASVNNDSLQFLLIWALTPIVIRIGRGELGTRTMALAGVVTGLGLLTKGYSLMMLAWVALALALALLRAGRAALAPVVRAGAIYGAIGLAAGGWWWVRNLVLYGTLSKSRYNEIMGPGPGPGEDVVGFLGSWWRLTLRRFWGEFGYFDTRIPMTAVLIASAVFGAAILIGCLGRDRVAGTKAGDRLLMLSPLLMLMALQFRNALSGYLNTGRVAGLQGRYWFGALAAMSVLAALGIAKVLRARERWLPVVVAPAIALMQGVALATILGHYWGPPHSALTSRVRAVVAWAPFPGEVIALAALAGAVVVVLTALEMVRFIRREPAAPAPAPAPAGAPPGA